MTMIEKIFIHWLKQTLIQILKQTVAKYTLRSQS